MVGETVLQHNFFDNLDLDEVRKGTATPPFVPSTRDVMDTKNFPSECTGVVI